MIATKSKTPIVERLRASPNFSLSFTLDGRPYVAKDVEPYIQYWLSERYRLLLSMFSTRRGATVDEAIGGYWRLTRTPHSVAESKRLLKAIEDMRSSGVLIGTLDDTSRYTAQIVAAYVAHRPFPREVSNKIIDMAPVTADSHVLDLAGGPGDLSIALAKVSDHVSLMELSKGFVKIAAKRAKQAGVNLTTLHDSCNRLMFRDEQYDVVTISQALHWMDDVLLCRGLCRVLAPGASFFVIYGAFEVEHQHPLSYLLGDKSILGHNVRQPLQARVAPILKRLTLLFDALDAPDVQRIDLAHQGNAGGRLVGHIVPASVSLFRQRRPMGVGFARAFLTPRHIAATQQAPEAFWKDLEARCANAKPDQMVGTYDWAVLHFRRGGPRFEPNSLESCKITEIGYAAPRHRCPESRG
jgi:2-polyprenyl-3-methyl-5-hydroxy-6-metoxy-1,4-benzoquinol methylase